jgi:sugar transferase (PEP-CTERM/EpsH1 system associated)
MKIIVLDEELPYPLNTGKRIRSYYLIKHLAKNHDVTYYAFGEEDDSYNFIKSSGIIPITVSSPVRNKSGLQFYLKLFLNLFSSYPFIVTNQYSSLYLAKLKELISSTQPDLIICEWTPLAVYIDKLKDQLTDVKKVVVAHNIESEIWRRYEQNEKNIIKKLYISIQRKKVERFERTCFKWFDGATAVSEQDKAFIEARETNYRSEVISNGVDTEYFYPNDREIEKNSIVFTGSMDWRPNQDAVVYFCEEILPKIKKEIPDVRFYIVGRKPPQFIRNLGAIQGVKITGTVDDVRPYMAGAGVYVVPLRIGGGSRLKILEAMAMEKAVVSTSVGAEGLNIKNNINGLIRNNISEFADAVVDCLSNRDKARSLGKKGREFVVDKHRWEKIGVDLDNYLSAVADGK